MIDCSKDLVAYYCEEVRLSEAMREKLRGHRKANQNRLEAGLKKTENPQPLAFVKQGSYAMRTTIRHPLNDYDIDDGAVFAKEDLVGPRGGELSPLEVRKMVRDSVHDERFNRAPEVRSNCVRVYYEEGHHVDIPAYRKCSNTFGDVWNELAGPDWRNSDPKGVTEWFNQAVIDKSTKDDNGRQMRRIVCLLKKFANSRASWNMPSGFILSILANEWFTEFPGRDDQALHSLLERIHSRLCAYLTVRHPVVDENVTKGTEDPCMVELRSRLQWALDQITVLRESDCSRATALKAWGKIFNTDFFEKRAQDSAGRSCGFGLAGAVPSHPVEKRGANQFG